MTDKDIAGLREQIRGALARGYCHTNNSRKVLDGDLILAMETEVMAVLEQALAALASPAGEQAVKAILICPVCKKEVERLSIVGCEECAPTRFYSSAPQPSAPPAAFTRVWGDAPDHMGEHNENSFCRQAGCTTAAPPAGEQERAQMFVVTATSPEALVRERDRLANEFATVREAGRQAMVKELAQWMIEHSFATGHGDKFADLLKELSWQVAEIRDAGRLAGIEEIAKYFEVSEEPDLAREIRRRARAAATQRKGPLVCKKCGGRTWQLGNGLCERCDPNINAASDASQ